MRSFFRSTSLIATLIGTLVAGIGDAAAYERGDGFVLSKSGRLASPGDFSGNYVTVQTRLHVSSVLCRLPIEIGMWNTPRPGRCN